MLDLLKKMYELNEAMQELMKQEIERLERSKFVQVAEGLGQDPWQILEAADVQDKLNISRSTYYRLVEEKKLVPRKMGVRHYYFWKDIEEQLDESKRKGRI